MGRRPGKINDTPFQMRASKQFHKSVDKWRARQPDKPSLAEAIRDGAITFDDLVGKLAVLTVPQ